MSFLKVPARYVPFVSTLDLERNALLQQARELKSRAAVLGVEKDVERIFMSSPQSNRGRPKGSIDFESMRNKADLLFLYELERAFVGGTDSAICERLFRRHGNKFGNSETAIGRTITKLKGSKLSGTILGGLRLVLRQKHSKRGRPPKKIPK